MNEYWKQAQGWFNFPSFYNTIFNGLKDGDTIVEVGIYKGKSILYLAEGIQERKLNIKLYGVDSFIGEPTLNETADDIRSAYHSNIRPFKDKIITIERASLEAVDTFADGSLAFVFIDAAHDYDNVKADILAWLPKVKKGGIIAGHDYNHPPVRKAVDELLTDLKHYHGNVWAYNV